VSRNSCKFSTQWANRKLFIPRFSHTVTVICDSDQEKIGYLTLCLTLCINFFHRNKRNTATVHIQKKVLYILQHLLIPLSMACLCLLCTWCCMEEEYKERRRNDRFMNRQQQQRIVSTTSIIYQTQPRYQQPRYQQPQIVHMYRS